ncbi:MAG: chemotaxis protein CheD [Bacillaceae bacterium]|nr:chemotaxis protein CheD [Bacillaceae bacterium]
MSKIVKVGMADLNVAVSPDKIRTTGLGSCVGVVLYDSMIKVAGMAHVMLPSSEIARDKTNPAKFADTAIPLLLEKMEKLGAVRRRLTAKMAGGAQMFSFSTGGDAMRIGQRNVEACKSVLEQLKIRLVAEDTGGNYGRTIEMDAETGILMIKTVSKGVKEV